LPTVEFGVADFGEGLADFDVGLESALDDGFKGRELLGFYGSINQAPPLLEDYIPKHPVLLGAAPTHLGKDSLCVSAAPGIPAQCLPARCTKSHCEENTAAAASGTGGTERFGPSRRWLVFALAHRSNEYLGQRNRLSNFHCNNPVQVHHMARYTYPYSPICQSLPRKRSLMVRLPCHLQDTSRGIDEKGTRRDRTPDRLTVRSDAREQGRSPD
jgi:hypothetical protein